MTRLAAPAIFVFPICMLVGFARGGDVDLPRRERQRFRRDGGFFQE